MFNPFNSCISKFKIEIIIIIITIIIIIIIIIIIVNPEIKWFSMVKNKDKQLLTKEQPTTQRELTNISGAPNEKALAKHLKCHFLLS